MRQIRYFRNAVAAGVNWYFALLEAVGRWQSPEETYQGRHYQYLIEGAAFDWQLLAERLCDAVDDLLPEMKSPFFTESKPRWILQGTVSGTDRGVKYRQYLNYFYAVTGGRCPVAL